MVSHTSFDRLRSVLSVAVAVVASSGCGPAKEAAADSETETDGASSTGDNASISASGAMTAADSTGGQDDAMTTVATSADTGLSTGMDEAGFIDPTGGSDGGEPQPLGGMCESNDGCVSEFCYTIPMLGGVCSECLMDSDCAMGTCALSAALGYAACTDGSQGVMCDSDEGCMGELICAEVLDTGGIFPATFCSQCDTDLPCPGEQICTPEYNLGSFGGSLTCADAGSVADGGGCPIGPGGGDGEVCASGFCGVADLFMFLELGVCGECVVDEDCMDPKLTCAGPTADMSGITPAVCQ